MSIRLIAMVLDHGPKDRCQTLVMLALADRSDDQGRCWPGRDELARRARCSPRSVTRVLGNLEKDGWISKKLRTGTSSRYQINVHRLIEGELAYLGGGGQDGYTQNPVWSQLCPGGVDTAMSRGCGHSYDHLTVNEPSLNLAREEIDENEEIVIDPHYAPHTEEALFNFSMVTGEKNPSFKSMLKAQIKGVVHWDGMTFIKGPRS